MKTLNEQFDKIRPRKHSPGFTECYTLNNYLALQILRFISIHKCKLEHRSDLNSDNWKPGTMREFIYSITQAGVTRSDFKVDQFDNWALNFWRIKSKASQKEIERLLTVENNEED